MGLLSSFTDCRATDSLRKGFCPQYRPLLASLREIQVSFAFAIVHSTALLLGKASALVLLYRIFVTRKFRVAVRILSTVLLLWWLASLIGLLAVCVPIETYWNPFVGGHCGNWYIFNLVIPIPWIVTDFAILILPIPVIWTLQLPRSEKISIGAVFLTGASYDIPFDRPADGVHPDSQPGRALLIHIDTAPSFLSTMVTTTTVRYIYPAFLVPTDLQWRMLR